MHTHTYIYNAEEEVEMKFSCIECKKELNCKYIYICTVCRRWPCNGHREHLEILSDYGGNSPDKGILERLKKERNNLAFYTSANKPKP